MGHPVPVDSYFARSDEPPNSLTAAVEMARRLYARYRTDDLLNSLKKAASGSNGKPQPSV